MTAPHADRPRSVLGWFWPPPAIAGRLWPAVAAAAAYTAVVYFGFPGNPLGTTGWLTVTGIVNVVVLGALVGFRTKAAYDRWWEGRILWGKLVNDLRNLCLKAVALADPPAADRRELLRLAAGFPVALMRSLRGPTALRDVPGFGDDPAAPAHVPAYLAGRVFALVAGWRAAGRIDGHALRVLDPHAAALMDASGGCERIRNTPLPGSYLSLVRHGLILSFVLLPWHLTHALGAWALPVSGVIVYFLFGVELVAEEQENPFGFDGDDLPLERYCDTIRANAAEILGV
jgi:putative membrane protein